MTLVLVLALTLAVNIASASTSSTNPATATDRAYATLPTLASACARVEQLERMERGIRLDHHALKRLIGASTSV